MNPMVPGLTGGKMSSSEVDSKIDLLDSREAVERKLMSSACLPSEPENGVMAFINYVVFPVMDNQGKKFTLKSGTSFTSFDALKEQFIAGKVCGEDIKKTVVTFLNGLLDSIRKEFESDELKKLSTLAYPKTIESASSNPPAADLSQKPLATSGLKPEEKLLTLTRNLEEFPQDKLSSLVEKNCNLLWEVDVSSRPTVSLLGHLSKVRDFISLGWTITVSVRDIQSHLDGGQIPLDIASHRANAFIEILKSAFGAFNIPVNQVTFIKGSEYQRKEDYVLDLYRMSALITCKEADDATANVLMDPTLLSGLIYPDMVALNEKHLEADVHYMPIKAKPLGEYAESHISVANGSATVHVYGHTMPSLLCRAALTPEEEYVELLELDSAIKKKVKAAFCEEGNVEFNPVLSLVRHIILPMLGEEKFVVSRAPEHGGNLEFATADALQDTFAKKDLHPGDLKNSVVEYLKRLITPIRKKSEAPAMKKLLNLAYPPPPKKVKGPAKPAAGGKKSEEFAPSQFNMVVGKIVDISLHPDADSLYVEQIDVGEDAPRTIVSGLVKHVPIEAMQDRLVVVLANLKPQSMRGVRSCGMVLCASVSEPSPAVEPLVPAEGSRPGDRVVVEGLEGEPDTVLNTKKSDALTKMLQGFKTNSSLQASWNGSLMQTPAGAVTVPSLKNAPIK